VTKHRRMDVVRIPVKLIDGRWYGIDGHELNIRANAVGELVLDRRDVEDKALLERLNQKLYVQVLGEDAVLRVALTIRDEPQLAEPLKKHFASRAEMKLGAEYYHTAHGNNTQFVDISLGPATKDQCRRDPEATGGLWLQADGLRIKGLVTSTICVPKEVSEEPLGSLNHAFTRLSEVYEPWRISHTGNIFTRILYQESDDVGTWYPLEVLRKASAATDSQLLAKAAWEDICGAQTQTTPGGTQSQLQLTSDSLDRGEG